MVSTERRAYLELHFAVLLYGLTAILGDLIQLSALVLVWWRVLIVSLSLLAFVRLSTLLRELGWQQTLRFAGIGVLTGLHWLTFYGSIKLSNASITLICMATTSFFTSLLEPLIVRRPFQWVELALGLLIIPGMVLVVDNTDADMNLGILVGLVSAFLAALFGTLNKKYISSSDPTRITFLELGSAWVFLGLLLPFYLTAQPDTPFWPAPADWGYLLVLALLCTTLAYILTLRALVHLSAFAANLAINLEPVYGIALAYVLLNDSSELEPGFYLGGLLILLVVFSYPFLRRLLRRRAAQ